MIKRILFDPKFFNYVIMSGYWLSALAITATVTFLYEH